MMEMMVELNSKHMCWLIPNRLRSMSNASIHVENTVTQLRYAS